jgi:hypothetical protein
MIIVLTAIHEPFITPLLSPSAPLLPSPSQRLPMQQLPDRSGEMPDSYNPEVHGLNRGEAGGPEQYVNGGMYDLVRIF